MHSIVICYKFNIYIGFVGFDEFNSFPSMRGMNAPGQHGVQLQLSAPGIDLFSSALNYVRYSSCGARSPRGLCAVFVF